MQDRGGQFNAVLITFIVLCTFFTSLRCFVRGKFTKLGLDDLFAVLALIVFTGLCADLLYGIDHGGIGKHIFVVPVDTYSTGIKTFLIAELLYTISTCLIKIAFSITLLRIIDKRVYVFATYAIYAVIVAVSVPAVIYFFFALFSCKPVSYLWGQLDPHKTGTCRPPHELMTTSYTHGAVIFICDTTLATIPVFLISKLPLSRGTKVAAGILLGLGSITSVVTLARFPFIHRLNDPDTLYATLDLSILAIVEVGTGIIATAAGTLRPLFVRAGIFPISGGSSQPDTVSSERRRASGQISSAPETNTDVESFSAVIAVNDKGDGDLGKATVGPDSIV